MGWVVFLERFVLGALATTAVALALTNPMGWEPKLRVFGTLIVCVLAGIAAYFAHRVNHGKTASTATTQNPVPPAAPSLNTPEAHALPATLPDARILIRQSPESLVSMCKNLTGIESSRRMEPYIGKWIQVIGNLDAADDYFGKMRLDFWPHSGGSGHTTIMTFDTDKWGDHINLLQRGTRITVLGKISRVDSVTLQLTDCELILP
jgi:hypothetical protein